MTAQSVTAGKIAEVIFENALETFESQQMMLNMVDFWEPDDSTLQNSNNFIWRNVEQHAPVIEGWDLTGLETGIIEETYPALLGTPTNDYVTLRADNLRDRGFWERRGRASGERQASFLNQAITSAMVNQASLHYHSETTSGFDFISEGQALMNERQMPSGERCFLLNDRSNQAFASELAGRATLQGRPADTWNTGQIGANVAEFDVYTGSFIPTLDGGASPNTTVTGNHSFAPEGGAVNATSGNVSNVDYRVADLTVASSALYTVGDKVAIINDQGGFIDALGRDDKTNTGQPMTFTVAAIPDGTTLTLYPKPIAADDAALSTEELAYANVDTTIDNAAIVVRRNTQTSIRPNLFWDKGAVEVMGGSVPAQLFQEFGGKRVITERMSNGLTLYMLYDGAIADMTLSFRMFTWYGITVKAPQNVGVAERRATT
tara:strand:- start:3662 stop:4960 length:1299 start_codon:yes stop_codon:yes gene_type:complete